MPQDRVSPELNEQLRRDRTKIADELPELAERHDRMMEAQAEDTFSGHLRRAVHRSGRLVREVAADAGISSQTLCDFLEGTRTLRSDVLDRLAQAVDAAIAVEPRQPSKRP
jgi:transcriptional regulator with XRE-family HTH domain